MRLGHPIKRKIIYGRKANQLIVRLELEENLPIGRRSAFNAAFVNAKPCWQTYRWRRRQSTYRKANHGAIDTHPNFPKLPLALDPCCGNLFNFDRFAGLGWSPSQPHSKIRPLATIISFLELDAIHRVAIKPIGRISVSLKRMLIPLAVVNNSIPLFPSVSSTLNNSSPSFTFPTKGGSCLQRREQLLRPNVFLTIL